MFILPGVENDTYQLTCIFWDYTMRCHLSSLIIMDLFNISELNVCAPFAFRCPEIYGSSLSCKLLNRNIFSI